MKTVLLFCCFLLLTLSYSNSQVNVNKVVKKIAIRTDTSITVIVSGSIRGTGGGNLEEEDPIAGVLVWFISNGEDCSMAEARLLRGTTYYKPDPDTVTFSPNPDISYLYLCAITDTIGDTNNYVSKYYQVTVNNSAYQVGLENTIELQPLILTAVNQSNGEFPTSFRIKQNYPNPFNPSTTIEYQIAKQGNVEVSIYDINGRLVKTVQNGTQYSGSYSVVWDSKDENNRTVSSGTYFYQVKSEGVQLVKKMLLVK